MCVIGSLTTQWMLKHPDRLIAKKQKHSSRIWYHHIISIIANRCLWHCILRWFCSLLSKCEAKRNWFIQALNETFNYFWSKQRNIYIYTAKRNHFLVLFVYGQNITKLTKIYGGNGEYSAVRLPFKVMRQVFNISFHIPDTYICIWICLGLSSQVPAEIPLASAEYSWRN